jgi:PAS domain S-box-containing protein
LALINIFSHKPKNYLRLLHTEVKKRRQAPTIRRRISLSSDESDMFPDLDTSILNALPDPIAILDTRGKVLWCNTATFSASQLTPREVLGLEFTSLPGFRASDIPRYVKSIASIVSGKQVDPIELIWKRKDGTTIRSEARASMIHWLNGQEAILAVAREILSFKEKELDVGGEWDDEDKRKRFFEHAQTSFFRTRISDGMVLDCNQQGVKLFGFDRPEEMIGKEKLLDYYYSTQDRQELIRELNSKGFVDNYLLHLKKRDGSDFWVELSSIQDTQEGSVDTVAIDVTERKRAEAALVASEERYRELIDNLPAGVSIADLNETLMLVNPSFCEILGYRRDELQGISVLDILRRDEYEKIRAETQIRTTGATSVYETRLIRKDGVERDVRVSAVPYRNNQNEIVGTIGLVLDITEAKLDHAALKASEMRMKSLIEQLPLGVAIVDLDERIELVNQAFSEIARQSKESLIGRNLLEYLSPECAETMTRETMSRTYGARSTYDITLIRTDGVRRDVRVFAAPNYDDHRKVVGSVGVFEDITDQKQNEVIRTQQEQEIDLYGSLLRHDLRNDIGLIVSYIEAVKMSIQTADEEVLTFLNSAMATAERMTDLVKSFGKPQVVREVDIMDFIRGIADETEKADKTLKIDVAYESGTPPFTVTAGGLLALVFMNLFRNASQHAGPNPVVEVKISVSEEQMNILVSDNGPGVPQEFRDRLFSRCVSSKGEAGGIGLYLSRQIMERTGGSIELLPERQGATFLIRMPISS